MAISTPDVITRYFAAQAARDFDTLVTLFADDAVVIDDGQTSRGTTEIRAWRENVALTASSQSRLYRKVPFSTA